MRISRYHAAAFACAFAITTATFAGPTPVGTSTTTVSYTTGSGQQMFAGDRNYLAVGPADATPLSSAPNIRTFNSSNTFGRRTFVAGTGPQFSHVLGDNESQIAHAFFKIDMGADYFPGITSDSMITINVENIMFDQAVDLVDNTLMVHTLWADPQVGQLSSPYFNLHNHEIPTADFRDFNDFSTAGVFSTFPVANFVLGSSDVDVMITGEGTNELGLSVSFPYSMLEHAEELGQAVPGGLPAPHGFLEPFHFHVEYVVTPEPVTLAMLAPGAVWLMRRKRRNQVAD